MTASAYAETRAAARDAASGRCASALWITRALTPSPAAHVPPPPQHTCTWHVQLDDYASLGHATVYTYGSMVGGAPRHAGLCARLGWGMALVAPCGAIIASASGRTPSWIRSVPGADAWALLQAAAAFGDAPAYRVDCLAPVQTYDKGFKKATAASSPFADTWSQIQAAWDGNEAVDIAWMPSHTAAIDVGECVLSNGALLTAVDRESNAAADVLAQIQHLRAESPRPAGTA